MSNNVIVTMRGMLSPIELEEDFAETANRLNMAAAQGKEFVATTDGDGRHILLKMDNILVIHEKDGDDVGLVG